MKKLINDPRRVVAESLEGFAAAHSGLVTLDGEPPYIARRDAPVGGKVAVLSGGGSGHEPLHIGFVGAGMLDAAVPGEVFTSPTPDPIVAATKAVASGAGVLYLVKNYTGDVLNFETAAELARLDGLEVRSVLIDDDVSVTDSSFTAGRRGVAGALVVEKMAGAAAERGDDIGAVQRLAERAVAATRSMGVALSAPTVPHSGRPSFDLSEEEVEFGVGVHGEPGRARLPMKNADAIVDDVVAAILADGAHGEGDDILLFVNGLGGTPLAELFIVYRRAAEILTARGMRIVRSLVGDYVTSLEMHGFSVTLTRLDEELTQLWDAPVQTAALRWGR